MKSIENKYIGNSIISVIAIGFFSVIVMCGLFYGKVLDWDQVVNMLCNIAGGIVGCIGTIFAVHLTYYQSIKIQEDNKKEEYKKLAYENMPIFRIYRKKDYQQELSGRYIEKDINTEQIDNIKECVKENGECILDIDFIITNISEFFVKLDKVSIESSYCEKLVCSIYPDEREYSYNFNSEKRSKEKKVIFTNYSENYSDGIIKLGESREIKVELKINKEFNNIEEIYDKIDIYNKIILEFENNRGQNFKQELMLYNFVNINDRRRIIICNEKMPLFIEESKKL